MPRIHLTKSAIDALPVSDSDTVFWDEGLPGFGVKVTPNGRKVFIVLYRLGGAGSRLRKFTIGPYGRVTLAQARAHAQKIFAARLDGRDPAAEKQDAKRKLVVDGINDLIETYIVERVNQLASAAVIRNRLRRELLGRWSGKSIHEIKKRNIIELVGEISQRNPGVAHRVLKVIRTFFRWCVARGIIEVSPAEGVSSFWRDKSRDKVLTDLELARIIRGARQLGGAYGGIVEFLALTGQRREEVAQMVWGEVNEAERMWSLPGHRIKNRRTHMVHLSDQALEVLARFPRGGRYVFETPQGGHYNAFSQSKRELDEICGVTGWRLHDLRRTVVSGMARLGVPPHVADKILNHQSGTISGVAAVYQRHEFMVERKEALERWGAHVTHIRAKHEADLNVIRSVAA